MLSIRLGLVGLGKIAQDQHLPALAGNPAFSLTAIASRNASLEGPANFATIEEMVSGCALDAVSLCTPPNGRYGLASAALAAGLHVMLEKPPGATLTEVVALADLAAKQGLTLFATWHSREAEAVEPAREWLSDKRVEAVRIEWRENIREWHPGQEWILGPGGYGVFDPAINALSIATAILAEPMILQSGVLDIPEGRASPISGELELRCGSAPVAVSLDFLETGRQRWTIEVDTDQGTLRLLDGGARLELPEGPAETGAEREYSRLYEKFARLIAARQSDVDLAPMRIVADAFLLCDRRTVAPFSF